MASLDTLVVSSRVLAEFGLRGSYTFSIPDGTNPDPTPNINRVYPDETTERVVMRMSDVPITPGHVIALEVSAVPSGPLQKFISTNLYEDAGIGGSVLLEVTYTNDDAETVTVHTAVTPPTSQEVYGAEPPSCHDSITEHVALALPWTALPSAVDRQKWTRGGVTVDIVVRYVGSPRVVDGCVVEHPALIVVDQADAVWPTAMYVDAGEPYSELPNDFPISQVSSTDPGGGLVALRRALEQHGVQLGPMLAYWHSGYEKAGTLLGWLDYDEGTGDDEAPPVTGNATSFRWLVISASPASPLPGFTLGGYARKARDSDEWFDGRTGVLPVWFCVYAKATAGVFQFRAGNDEWAAVNVTRTGGAYGWGIAPGWIEVGTSPEDGPLGRFYAKDTGGATWSARAAAAFYRQV